MKYRPELDALRVVAFLGVFAFHSMSREASFYPAFGALAFVPAALATAGMYGVDLFFVLSAYLITSLLRAEHAATGRIDRRAFYVRRVLRIWPLYFAALSAAAFITPSLLTKDGLPPAALLAFAVFGGNWYVVAFDFPTSVASALWSVSIEEQFYLLCPFGVRRIPWIAAGLLVVATLARVALVTAYGEPVPHHVIWANTVARLDPLALGMLLACLPPLPRQWRWCVLAASALAFVALPNLPLSVLARYPLMALACMGIVAAVLGLRVPGIVARLGRLTYGLYVVHLFALSAVGVYVKPLLVGVPGAYWLALVLAFALSVALAAASYAAIERPFLRLKARYSSNG